MAFACMGARGKAGVHDAGGLCVYLWDEMIRPTSDVAFVGDVRNVVACHFICQQICLN
ncbi:hypothetical protein EAZG_05125 [Escherichia coli TA249]|nr:hypothetical protein EAZG_05125 [Escherichia coli TA249]